MVKRPRRSRAVDALTSPTTRAPKSTSLRVPVAAASWMVLLIS
jgi:hypothetical protein